LSLLIKKFTVGNHYWIFILFLRFTYGADDTELWSSIGFETELPYNLKVELEQELRLKDQLSSFKQTFTQVSISYNILDGIKIIFPIRYAIYQNKIKQRLSFGGIYKYNFKTVSYRYRIKFQKIYENSEFSNNLIRNKVSIEYKINKKIKPYISGEIFHLDNLNQYQYDEYRVSFGINLNLPKKKEIKIFYIYKLEDISKSNLEQTNAFGAACNFNL
tara:strand:+ start:514 stop:1164 length:651 start_codon:yes stop_codon:yes gene_type:complete